MTSGTAGAPRLHNPTVLLRRTAGVSPPVPLLLAGCALGKTGGLTPTVRQDPRRFRRSNTFEIPVGRIGNPSYEPRRIDNPSSRVQQFFQLSYGAMVATLGPAKRE